MTHDPLYDRTRATGCARLLLAVAIGAVGQVVVAVLVLASWIRRTPR